MTGFHVRLYEGMDALPPAYEQVFARAAEESLFLSATWFRNFERTVLGDAERARIYGVESGQSPGSPIAALVTRLQRGRRGLLSPVRLESLANYYTAYFAPVVGESTNESVVVRALAKGLWDDRSAWDVLDLRPMAEPDAPRTSTLLEALRATGIVVQRYFCFGNWYLDVAGRSYEDYLAGLSSMLRKNVPYASRKLARAARSRVEIVTDAAGLEAALSDYEKVYRASWKIPEPYPAFIRGLARSAAGLGWLRLGLVYVDDEPAAAQLWLVQNGTASIFKVAYDERFARLSVGTILTARLMQHVIDVDRVQCVDYLSGDDDHKKNWMSHRRERWGVLAFNPRSVRGALQAIWRVGGRKARNLVPGYAAIHGKFLVKSESGPVARLKVTPPDNS